MACLGEAQIIAKIASVSKSVSTCIATVSPYSIVQYNESGVCALDLGEVLDKGIIVNCSYEAGQDFSGVLVKDADGAISLER